MLDYVDWFAPLDKNFTDTIKKIQYYMEDNVYYLISTLLINNMNYMNVIPWVQKHF
jgi:hypothetical protein